MHLHSGVLYNSRVCCMCAISLGATEFACRTHARAPVGGSGGQNKNGKLNALGTRGVLFVD